MFMYDTKTIKKSYAIDCATYSHIDSFVNAQKLEINLPGLIIGLTRIRLYHRVILTYGC